MSSHASLVHWLNERDCKKPQEHHGDFPSGFHLWDSVITWHEHEALLGAIHAREWSNALKRRTQQYGYTYDYSRHEAPKPTTPIPDIFRETYGNIAARTNLGFIEEPDQVIVNEYEPGQGISAHVDHTGFFGPEILSLSLGSPCTLQLETDDGDCRDLSVDMRSVYKLEGDARYKWKHSILPRKRDRFGTRFSITYRNMKKQEEEDAGESR